MGSYWTLNPKPQTQGFLFLGPLGVWGGGGRGVPFLGSFRGSGIIAMSSWKAAHLCKGKGGGFRGVKKKGLGFRV